ncbi:unnamed protein product [Caenorhabditis sp. 36 PRJEB53466]|nr:unnamed protein product [Caenorhabditis sp. 36 PRJEB53466]
MRSFFGILAISLLVLNSASASPIRSKRMPISEVIQFVNGVNEARRQAAKSLNVANVWKMQWNDVLDTKVQAIASSCSDIASIRVGSDYRYMKLEGTDMSAQAAQLEMLGKISEQSEEARKAALKHIDENPGSVIELGIPEQSSFACVEYNCGQQSLLCLIGPESSLINTDVKRGIAGTECWSGKSEDGLCIQ